MFTFSVGTSFLLTAFVFGVDDLKDRDALRADLVRTDCWAVCKRLGSLAFRLLFIALFVNTLHLDLQRISSIWSSEGSVSWKSCLKRFQEFTVVLVTSPNYSKSVAIVYLVLSSRKSGVDAYIFAAGGLAGVACAVKYVFAALAMLYFIPHAIVVDKCWFVIGLSIMGYLAMFEFFKFWCYRLFVDVYRMDIAQLAMDFRSMVFFVCWIALFVQIRNTTDIVQLLVMRLYGLHTLDELKARLGDCLDGGLDEVEARRDELNARLAGPPSLPEGWIQRSTRICRKALGRYKAKVSSRSHAFGSTIRSGMVVLMYALTAIVGVRWWSGEDMHTAYARTASERTYVSYLQYANMTLHADAQEMSHGVHAGIHRILAELVWTNA